MDQSANPPTADPEQQRAAAIADLFILDTAPEAEYDQLLITVADFLEAPIAAISILDRERIWFKARIGIEATETPSLNAFCRHVVSTSEALVVEDASIDERFCQHEAVHLGDGIRFYAGAPLILGNGMAVGTLCVLDRQLRPSPDARQIQLLQNLARQLVARLEKRAEERLRRMMIELSKTCSDAIISADANGTITTWNPAASRIFGWEPNEAIGRGLDLIVPPRLFPKHQEGFRRRVREGAPARLGANNEVPGLHRDGHEIPIEVSMSVWCGDGPESGVGTIIRDISERHRNEEYMRRLAHYDNLTGTPNRITLNGDLATRFRGTHQLSPPFALALLDIDSFKDINDALGHTRGDIVLVQIAERMVTELSDAGTLYRLGGDEFAIVLPGIANSTSAALTLSRLHQVISLPMEIDGIPISLEASIGFAVAPYQATTADELVANADLSLYQAKRTMPRTPCCYTEELRRSMVRRRSLETELRDATLHNQFELYYQPQIDHNNKLWKGAEALLRWNHPGRGVLTPIAFMDTLEASSLTCQLGNWIVLSACQQAAEWRTAGFGFEKIGINLFASQLRHPNFLGDVRHILNETGLDPTAIEFEITERIALSLEKTTLATLHGLRDMGIKLAFDDFGTGYASLSALKRYPVDRLKIDRAFVDGLPDDASNTAIVASIIAMADAFDLEVIAEGVETNAQRECLAQHGCREFQGYLFGKPMPAQRFENFARRQEAELMH